MDDNDDNMFYIVALRYSAVIVMIPHDLRVVVDVTFLPGNVTYHGFNVEIRNIHSHTKMSL